jgi:hypothetical protein
MTVRKLREYGSLVGRRRIIPASTMPACARKLDIGAGSGLSENTILEGDTAQSIYTNKQAIPLAEAYFLLFQNRVRY